MSQETEKFLTAETEGSDEAVGIKNNIQIALLLRHIGKPKFTFQEFDEWKNTYSKKFQHIFDRLIKSDPHFWLHDQQTRDATLMLFEDEFKKEEGQMNPEKEEEEFEEK